MADYDLKTISPDTSFADGNFLFGADDQSSATPVPYSSAGVKAWIEGAAHTWSTTQTLTLAPVFTDQSGSRTALGLGTAATQATGTSGATLPFLNGTNTWASTQTFTLAPVFTDASGSRTALGLGTAATQNTGTSGATIPILNGANTWGATQVMTHLTIEGVTSTGATGTGSLVFAAAPALTGLLTLGTGPALMTSPAAASFQHGDVDNAAGASVVAQTLRFQSVAAGGTNNQTAKNTTIIGSLSTGTGTNGDIIFQTGATGTSGSTQNTATTAFTIKGETQITTFTPIPTASLSGLRVAGTLLTGGTGTTNFPHVIISPGSPTGATTWSTSGTLLGMNPASLSGNFLDFRVNGGSSVFNVTSSGGATFANSVVATAFLTTTGGFSLNNSQSFLTSTATGTIQHGVADAASPVAQTIKVQSVSAGTADTAGQNWTFSASASTGAGVPGDIVFKTSGKGAASTTQNTLLTALTIKGGTTNNTNLGQPSIVIGSAALSTTATDGFLYIPTCAGTPTGVPTAFTGRVALCYDTTNHQFWIYDGAWLQPKTPAAAATVTWQ